MRAPIAAPAIGKSMWLSSLITSTHTALVRPYGVLYSTQRLWYFDAHLPDTGQSDGRSGSSTRFGERPEFEFAKASWGAQDVHSACQS